MSDFEKEVKHALIDKNMTMSDLASNLGISTSYVSDLLKNKRGNERQIQRIRDFHGVPGHNEGQLRALVPEEQRGVVITPEVGSVGRNWSLSHGVNRIDLGKMPQRGGTLRTAVRSAYRVGEYHRCDDGRYRDFAPKGFHSNLQR